MDRDNTTYGLIVSFPDQSESFVLGFEAGEIWSLLTAEVDKEVRLVHSENKEVIKRMCKALNYKVEFEGFDDPKFEEWCEARFARRLCSTTPRLTVVPNKEGYR
jgi:hypothetical protein